MNAQEVLKELEAYGDERTKNTLMKHGAKEPFFGVKVADLKKILKKTKKNHELSLELYTTGNSDAMYLAGLMADETKITETQLEAWVDQAYWYYLSEYAVPWVASETPFGFELGLKWIESDHERVADAGWATLSGYAAIHEDDDLDIEMYRKLLHQVGEQIHSAQNRVGFAMNSFVIAVGSYIESLTDEALEVGKKIGKVDVTLGSTACKVPLATEYVNKVITRGSVGKKRKTPRC
ncbi:MAG: DNA alkylation repair protein [FCB group bacterium]|nr:DNA alkylation repair protein [FCB group bacterium]MBL7028324.1 DNA alkylation repair protein [Candidatus Neomarinimicrobiota bacterium]MBL7121643.1 DNA alkylation repair protein [Candidatus Neomarinimicrobiota bacterium]